MRFGIFVLLALASFINLRGLDREERRPDERMWILQGLKIWPLFKSGEWDSPKWNDIDASWGYVNPPVAKYVMGIGLSARDVHWEWDGGNPPDSVLVAGRMPSAILGAAACGGLYWIGQSALSPPAGFIAGIFLAASPLWVTASRLAMADIHGAAWAIFSVGPFMLALKEIEGRRRWSRAVPWIVLSGILAGLALGAKLNSASTSAALGIVLLILLLREIIRPSRPGTRAAPILFVLGIGFAVSSAASFVLINPYLHHDPWNRFVGIIDFWNSILERQFIPAARGVSGTEGMRVLVGKMASPARSIVLIALIPLAGALAAKWIRGTRIPPERARLIGWLLLIPVAVTVGILPNQIVHSWILWYALLGGWISLCASARGEISGRLKPLLGFTIAVWAVTAAYFVWRMTYYPAPRYYIPILPSLCLAAGYGIASLRADVSNLGGSWSKRLLDFAVLSGVLSIVMTFPDYERAQVQRMSAPGHPIVFQALHWLTVAGLAISIGSALLGGSAFPSRRDGRPPSPRAAPLQLPH